MKQTTMLTTASLLSILFMTLHMTGDILFKMSPAGLVNLFGARFRSPAIWNSGAQRKAGGIHYHFPRVGPRAGHPCCPHERDAGSSRWRHRQLRPSFPFRVYNARVGHHRDVLHHPVGARTVELALAPAVTRLIRALPAWLRQLPARKIAMPDRGLRRLGVGGAAHRW